MEILIPGKSDPKWEKVIECQHCGATLKIFRTDLFLLRRDGGMGGIETTVSVICGCCNKHIVVEGCNRKHLFGELPTDEEFRRIGKTEDPGPS